MTLPGESNAARCGSHCPNVFPAARCVKDADHIGPHVSEDGVWWLRGVGLDPPPTPAPNSQPVQAPPRRERYS